MDGGEWRFAVEQKKIGDYTCMARIAARQSVDFLWHFPGSHQTMLGWTQSMGLTQKHWIFSRGDNKFTFSSLDLWAKTSPSYPSTPNNDAKLRDEEEAHLLQCDKWNFLPTRFTSKCRESLSWEVGNESQKSQMQLFSILKYQSYLWHSFNQSSTSGLRCFFRSPGKCNPPPIWKTSKRSYRVPKMEHRRKFF